MGPSVLRDFTQPYTAVESFFYDTLIAPAVVGMHSMVEGELLAELPKGACLLDVGCGGGHAALRLARIRPDLKVTGVDLSHEQVGRAKKRALEARIQAEFVQGSALDLPFAGATFDAVFSLASIKHWTDRARGLSECVRVLKPGGKLAVIEADRGARVNDIKAFVNGWRIPQFAKPLARVFFRTVVSGQSIDLDDARALLAALPLAECEVRRISGTPALLMRARVND